MAQRFGGKIDVGEGCGVVHCTASTLYSNVLTVDVHFRVTLSLSLTPPFLSLFPPAKIISARRSPSLWKKRKNESRPN